MVLLGRSVRVCALAVAMAVLGSVAGAGVRAAEVDRAEAGACIDEDVKADLDAKRRKRFTKTRLYQKTNRHELALRAGYFVADLFDGSWIAGGAYTYHLTEEFAVEAQGAYTRLGAGAGPELERIFAVLGPASRTTILFSTNLVFSPIYAKFQNGGQVVRFDVQFTVGAGVVDSDVSRGVAGNAGIGFLFWAGRALTFRLDIRDIVHQQQLLSEKQWVHDLVATLGISTFLPFSE